MTRARDLIAGAYEVPVTGEVGSPRYRTGERLLVHPDAQPRAGDDVLFSRDLGDGTRAIVIARLVRSTAKGWRVHRFNPEQVETLNRAAWPKAELIVGAFNARR